MTFDARELVGMVVVRAVLVLSALLANVPGVAVSLGLREAKLGAILARRARCAIEGGREPDSVAIGADGTARNSDAGSSGAVIAARAVEVSGREYAVAVAACGTNEALAGVGAVHECAG
jgi:hypothetical protein